MQDNETLLTNNSIQTY